MRIELMRGTGGYDWPTLDDPARRVVANEHGTVVFDDPYFPSNRLPDGSACTWHLNPGAPGRGRWIFQEALDTLMERLQAASRTVAQVVAEALPHLEKPAPSGSVYRFEP